MNINVNTEKSNVILKNKNKIIVLIVVIIAALAAFGVAFRKDTSHESIVSSGNSDVDFAMVIPHFSDFDMINERIAVRLSWTEETVSLENNKAELQLKSRIYPITLEDKSVSWKSSNEEIAKIDENGNIIASNPGTVEFTATLADGEHTAKASLSVIQPVRAIFMPTTTVTMYTNDSGRLLDAEITPSNASDTTIKWESKNTKVAAVDENGRVQPKGVGLTEIVATTADGGYESKCFVNVINPSVKVETVSIQNKDQAQMTVGETKNMITTVSPSNAKDKTLEWSSDNEGVATITQTGKVRGISEGETTITVKSSNGKTDQLVLSVSEGDTVESSSLVKDENGMTVLSVASQNTPDSGERVRYQSYSMTLPALVKIQMGLDPPPEIWRSSGVVSATEAETAQYMNPNEFYQDAYKYQFLDLSHSNGVSVDALNDFLADKGILKGHGADFLEAAQQYNVSEVYLVAHACLESGNGTSQLATGVTVNGVTVYNMYGIAAYDNSPLSGGSQKAYREGWTTVSAAIKGGAEWISKWYINSSDGRQNTLYKMLWNPDTPGQHQYATDIGWAVKQAQSIGKIFSNFPEATLTYEVPVYSGLSAPNID